MSDEEAMLRPILLAPADDGPRVVYADWLDERAGTVPCPRCRGGLLIGYANEPCPVCRGDCVASNGNAERANLIRVQCELARLGDRCREGWNPESGVGNRECGCRWHVLRRVEYELWRIHGPTIAEGLPGEAPAFHPGCMVRAGIGPAVEYRFVRGFVADARGPLNMLQRLLPNLITRQPIELAGPTDREPLYLDHGRHAEDGFRRDRAWMWQWWGGADNNPTFAASFRIPRPLATVLYTNADPGWRWHRASERMTNVYYPTRDDAVTHLAAAVLYLAHHPAAVPAGA